MINLIKNELSKLFHKKTIYVLGILCLGVILLNFLLYFSVDKAADFLYSGSINIIEESLDNYDLNNPEELGYYISDKVLVEESKLELKYKENSWQRQYISRYLNDIIFEMVSSEANKDKETYNQYKEIYDDYLDKINKGDWKYFINNEINELENQPQREETKIRLEILNYRLKNNLPYNNTSKSYFLDNYIDTAINYNQIKNKEPKNYEEKYNLMMTEKDYKESKYIIDNNIEVNDGINVRALLEDSSTSTIFFVLIAIILISGSIVSEEFNKGTIKQLLVKPYSRTKILLSKYITCLIIFFLFLIGYYMLSTIIYGFLDGYSSLSIPMVIYNFNTGKVLEMSLFKYIILNTLSLLPTYLIFLTFSFCIGIISNNSLISSASSFVLYCVTLLVDGFASGFTKSYLKYLPSLCWNFKEYMFGGIPEFKYATLTNSIIITLLLFVILISVSFIVFNKRNVKNQ